MTFDAVHSVAVVLGGVAAVTAGMWQVYRAVRGVVREEVATIKEHIQTVQSQLPDSVKLSLMNGAGDVVRQITHEVVTSAIRAHEEREATIAAALEAKVVATAKALLAEQRTPKRRAR